MMPVVCGHIFFCHIDLDVVTHCDAVMRVFYFNIIIVILPLISFQECSTMGFKLTTTCSSILECPQESVKDSHLFML